ncbi:hypothetical protein NA56DRAFT_642346 [Hyaloscypha hepaticicola]|uniref:Uncharacterized protein n=1 Tax=Hyaloscypha hepaticicola TaxID=2082293 RepID=A0A2J6QGG9_9HELO|nr:hypothetical protein NA56DRAFT_642346 [Hyaloscypha hepaticicola]
MSGASSWLQKMRKSELVELCDSVGYKDYEGQKKTDIEVGLDEYLTKNAATYSSDSRLAPFYKTRRGGESSPVKKEASSILADAETKVKQVKRRVTKVAEDFLPTDDSEIEQANTRARTALTRTPRASALAFASNVPLPPSPAVVADAIDRRTQALRTRVSKAYQQSGLTETAEATRETLSTVVAVQVLVTAFELYSLRKELLADRYAFTIPSIALLGTGPYDVKIPDLFLLLTSSFWGPATLWAFTSFFVPLFAAYFFNLTAKPSRTRSHSTHFTYAFDPLTFNIVKALLTFVVYGQDVTFGGLVDLEYVARINSALYGGWQGVLVGTGIGSLITLYEAVLKK